MAGQLQFKVWYSDCSSSKCGQCVVSHRGWQKGKCVNGCPVLRVQTEKTHGMSHVTGTKAIQHPTGPTPMAINVCLLQPRLGRYST
jgi:hypothetical protein